MIDLQVAHGFELTEDAGDGAPGKARLLGNRTDLGPAFALVISPVGQGQQHQQLGWLNIAGLRPYPGDNPDRHRPLPLFCALHSYYHSIDYLSMKYDSTKVLTFGEPHT